jgi:methyltransferase-like protein/cyclopropane fatty-acyl-phospholipid synthase-like methyltransferase
MSSSTSKNNPYDQTPYPLKAYVTSLPHRMAAVGRLFGLQPPDTRSCHVLELGCASAMNLIAMADMMPDARFIGIDLSRQQINQGNALIAELGLTNIKLRCQDILELACEKNRFDYIIAHGVYSWVPQNAREALLQIAQDQLHPSGIAYISYNTYPGWHTRQIVRDVMKFRTRNIGSPAEKVQAGRAIVKFLTESVAPEESHAALLKSELKTLDEISDNFLLHDHLEPENHPVYFQEFIRHAGEHGLSYLGESRIGLMWTEALGPAVSAGLKSITTDLIETEQYMDFLRNRMFRSTLLCYKQQRIDRSLSHTRLAGLFIDARVAQQPATNETPAGWTPFVIGGAALATGDAAIISILQKLQQAGPCPIPFDDLIEHAKLDPAGIESVGKQLIYFYLKGVIDILAAPFPCAALSDRPRARKLAQLLTKTGSVVSYRHENITLTPVAMMVLPMLDGSHDREFVIAELNRLLQENVLKLAAPASSPEEQLKAITEATDQTLQSFALHGLLDK